MEKLIEFIGDKDHLEEEELKRIKYDLQPLVVDLGRSKVEIPNIALVPNNPNCLNEFNEKQLAKLEKNYNKCLTKMTNFH